MPVLKQVVEQIAACLVSKLACKQGVDRQSRSFAPWNHVVSLVHTQLAHSLGRNDVCNTHGRAGDLPGTCFARTVSRQHAAPTADRRPAPGWYSYPYHQGPGSSDMQTDLDTFADGQFGVVTGVRSPQRLSTATRRLAARFICGEFGAAMSPAPFSITAENTPDDSALTRCVRAVERIAAEAPLRLLEDEKLVGAATFLEAACHRVPGCDIPGTSHTAADFERVLREGYRGLRKRLEDRRRDPNLSQDQRTCLDAMRRCLDAAGHWHRRYLDELHRRLERAVGQRHEHYRGVLAQLERVPEHPPRCFREAVQSLWLAWSFQRLCGNWSALGRVDKMLGPYLARDLADGVLTRDEARELLAHVWIKGCEWTGAATGHVGSSGDAQFYQNVVLGGIDADGNTVTNEVTYLILDVIEELHISDFPVAVRVGPDTPERLWRRIAEVQRRGGGIVAIYNEPLVITALTRFGYSLREARDFANDGCWEVIVPGKTAFSYHPFDALVALQEALHLGENAPAELPDYPSFEALYSAFLKHLHRSLEQVHAAADNAFSRGGPAPVLSLLVRDCIETARDYHNRGARYTVKAPHAGGLPDVANCLTVIRDRVYASGQLSLPAFVRILRRNWEGHDDLRQEIRRQTVFYGNGDPDADEMVRRVYEDYVRCAGVIRERNGVLRPPGISTFGRSIAFRDHRTAAAHGACVGDILATNFGPTPGTDRRGPTAVVQSFCRMDYSRLPNGVPLELKLNPQGLRNESGLRALIALMKAFVRLGGMYLHIDVVDSTVLREAQAHPERYPNLSVRISGWSARFATLSKPWQDMIIQRTEQGL